MEFKEVKKVLSKKDTYFSRLFPNLTIRFKEFKKKLIADIEAAMVDKPFKVGSKKLNGDLNSVLRLMNDRLVLTNLSEKEMQFLCALNSLIYNWGKLFKDTQELLSRCQKNDIVIKTHFCLKVNVEINRRLLQETKRIIAFRPRDITASRMYLEEIDHWFDEAEKEYGEKK